MRRITTSILFLLSFSLLGGAVFAQTTTVTLVADKDNTLYFNFPGAISNGSGDYIFIGNALNLGAHRRALLHFDVAAIVPAMATITSARLDLQMSRTIAVPTRTNLHTVSRDWGEGVSDAMAEEGGGTPAANGDATWLFTFSRGSTGTAPSSDSTWTNPGGDFNASSSGAETVAGDGSYSWGSTAQMVADVQSWLDSPTTNFGWILLGDETIETSAKRFDSRENPTEANRPSLVLEYTMSLPVELSSFTVKSIGDDVVLDWVTSSEENNAGFEIEMARTEFLVDGKSRGLSWSSLDFVEGQGSSTEEISYQFRHTPRERGSYWFRLKQVDFDGAFSYSEELEVNLELPGTHSLEQAYPNPFSDVASFDLMVAEDQNLEVHLLNTLGQVVSKIYQGEVLGGTNYSFKISAEDLPNGLYFYQVQGDTFTDVGQVQLAR